MFGYNWYGATHHFSQLIADHHTADQKIVRQVLRCHLKGGTNQMDTLTTSITPSQNTSTAFGTSSDFFCFASFMLSTESKSLPHQWSFHT